MSKWCVVVYFDEMFWDEVDDSYWSYEDTWTFDSKDEAKQFVEVEKKWGNEGEKKYRLFEFVEEL